MKYTTWFAMAIFPFCVLAEQNLEPQLRHWPAPLQMDLRFDEKAGAERTALPSVPMNLVAIAPCRVLDTRSNAPAAQRLIPGPIAANTAVEVPIRNNACGLPSSALGYSFNITVDTTQTGNSLAFLSAWPTGSRPANLVSVLNALSGGFVANAAVLAAGTNGSIDLFASGPTHVIIDVNGYFVPGTQGPVAVYRTPRGPDNPVCTLAASVTGQDYSIKEIDTDNAVSSAGGWRFTVPIAGYYQVTATLDQPNSATTFELHRFNPLAQTLLPVQPVRSVGVNSRTTTISTVLFALAGDSINTSTKNSTGCGGLGWISIHYVRP